jgi:hypothetical protein
MSGLEALARKLWLQYNVGRTRRGRRSDEKKKKKE